MFGCLNWLLRWPNSEVLKMPPKTGQPETIRNLQKMRRLTISERHSPHGSLSILLHCPVGSVDVNLFGPIVHRFYSGVAAPKDRCWAVLHLEFGMRFDRLWWYFVAFACLKVRLANGRREILNQEKKHERINVGQATLSFSWTSCLCWILDESWGT